MIKWAANGGDGERRIPAEDVCSKREGLPEVSDVAISDGRLRRLMEAAGNRASLRMRSGKGRWLYAGLLALSFFLVLTSFSLDASGPISIGLLICGILLALNVLYYLVVPFSRRAEGRRLNLLIEWIDTAPEPAILTGRDGHYLHANDAYRALVGKIGGTPPSPPHMRTADGANNPVFRSLMATAYEAGVGREEVELVSARGEPRAFRVTATWLRRGPDLILWRFEDVLRYQGAEGALDLDRQIVGGALAEAGIGYCSVDGDGTIESANDVLARWAGVAPDSLLNGGATLGDLLGEDGALDFARAVSELVEDPSSSRALDVHIRSVAGETVPVRLTPKLHLDAWGSVTGVSAVARDLRETASGSSGAAHAAADEARFATLFNEAPVGIVLIEAPGAIVAANAFFRELAGYEADTVIGTPLSGLLHDDSRSDVERLLGMVFEGGEIPAVVDVSLGKSKKRSAQMYLSRLEVDGALPSLILYLIDVTEQKNLEMRFAQSQKMHAVGQLAGGIAHDFNNLLTAILGFCDLLLARHGPGDPSFADIMQVQQNSKRAANLVRQLLAFSRQQTLQPTVLDITGVIAELSHMLRRVLGETVTLRVVHGRNLGLVQADPTQLEQVITNLAVNSRDAMPNGGALTIKTSRIGPKEAAELGHDLMPPADYVRIEVTDTGSGIPREVLGEIFEPFFTTKEVGKGTGLGLSTVYGIVKQTGGFIFPESEVGKGTTFRIYLPVYQEGEEKAVKTEAQDPKPFRDLTGKARVLLVEDEDAVRIFAARALKNKGYTVLEAESGERALQLLDENIDSIDLVISDVVMPRMDGPELLGKVRERRKDMKIIFISGYAEDAFRKSLGKAEFSFLPKPFSLKQLAERVKEVLER